MHTRQSILAAIAEFYKPRKLVPTPDTVLQDHGRALRQCVLEWRDTVLLNMFLEDRYGISIKCETSNAWTTVDSVIDTVIAALPYAESQDIDLPESPNLDSAIRDILTEFHAATANFPHWPTDPLHALSVVQHGISAVQNEVLQLAYEPHKSSVEKVRKEAIQMAAMSLRFLLSLDAYKYAPGEQHEQQQ